MMIMNRCAVVALVLVVGSCGGGSSNGGGGSFTSVPAGKGLNTLTPTELSTLCMDIGKSFSDSQLQQGTCKFSAYFLTALSVSLDSSSTDAQLQAICTQTYNGCLAQEGDGGTGMCTQPGAACTATVGELSACLKDTKAQFVAAFSAVPSCSAVTRANILATEGADGGAPPMESVACMTFNTKCPDGMIPDPSSDITN